MLDNESNKECLRYLKQMISPSRAFLNPDEQIELQEEDDDISSSNKSFNEADCQIVEEFCSAVVDSTIAPKAAEIAEKLKLASNAAPKRKCRVKTPSAQIQQSKPRKSAKLSVSRTLFAMQGFAQPKPKEQQIVLRNCKAAACDDDNDSIDSLDFTEEGN